MAQHLTAIIADDEPFMREALKEHLLALWPELDIVAEAGDGPQAVAAISRCHPDIAFLDIRMPGLTGLQVAQLTPESTKVVFVTAYDSHALEAFEACAVDYVLKPLDPMRLAKVVTRLRSMADVTADTGNDGLDKDGAKPLAGPLGQSNHQAAAQRLGTKTHRATPELGLGLQWLHVSVGTQLQMVHVDDVMFFESDTKYTRVVSADCDGLIRTSLKELLAQVPDSFVQVHRSAVVNRHFIKAIHRIDDAMEIEIRGNSTRLKVSESNRPVFKAM